MIRKFIFPLLIIFILGCVERQNPNIIRLVSLLHDDSSKVWLVESEKINDQEYASKNINFKTVIVFYNDLTFSEQPLNEIGNKPPKYGIIEIKNELNAINFTYSQKTTTYKIEKFTKDEVVLSSTKGEKNKTILKLISLPKL